MLAFVIASIRPSPVREYPIYKQQLAKPLHITLLLTIQLNILNSGIALYLPEEGYPHIGRTHELERLPEDRCEGMLPSILINKTYAVELTA